MEIDHRWLPIGIKHAYEKVGLLTTGSYLQKEG
jgi:hypothetical protein